MTELVSLLTLPEVAQALRVSERTVARLLAAGRLRPTHVGRRTLVTSREVAAFIAGGSRRVA